MKGKIVYIVYCNGFEQDLADQVIGVFSKEEYALECLDKIKAINPTVYSHCGYSDMTLDYYVEKGNVRVITNYIDCLESSFDWSWKR